MKRHRGTKIGVSVPGTGKKDAQIFFSSS